MDGKTPNHILIEETKVKELRLEAKKRAIKYEEKARKSEKKLVIECIKEMDKEGRKREESKWEGKRRKEMEKWKISKEELRELREMEGAEEITQKIMDGERRREGEERKKRIEESKYNIHYKDIRTEKLPEYLRGRRKKKERNGIARYRCGNETRGS